jgi:hypothetical protein
MSESLIVANMEIIRQDRIIIPSIYDRFKIVNAKQFSRENVTARQASGHISFISAIIFCNTAFASPNSMEVFG